MNVQFKKGVLELIVLMVVSEEDIYGYELVRRVKEVLHVNEGTIYPLLKRMMNEEYFEIYYLESTEGPMRKYYRLTESGKDHLAGLKEEWLRFSKGIELFIADHERKKEEK